MTEAIIPVPVQVGLNLASPESGLQPGELVRAQNLRAGAWGPRQGHTYVDRASRGRSDCALNGTDAYVALPYISKQMDLGTVFCLDLLLKIDTLPSSNPDWIWGNAHATDRDLDVYLNTNGKITARLEDGGSNSTTLTSTSSVTAGDTVHIRVYRDGATARLYYDTTLEAVSTDLSATSVLNVVAEDRWVGKPVAYASGEWFDGTIGGIYLRSFGDEDFTYAYSELPGPRGAEVLGAWTGEVLDTSATLYDASVFGNHGVVANGAGGSRVPEVYEPIQYVGHAALIDGQEYNVVMVGGRLYVEAV